MANVHVINRIVEPGIPPLVVDYHTMLKALANDIAICAKDCNKKVSVDETMGVHDQKVYVFHDINERDTRWWKGMFRGPRQLVTAYNRAFNGLDPMMIYVAQMDRMLNDFPESTRSLRFIVHAPQVNGHCVADVVRSHAEFYADRYHYSDIVIETGACGILRALAGR
ncbi:MAG: hypothetical protein AABY13_06100 [Nanoarchaeota archaeon]